MLSSKIKYLILCGLILVFMINLTACDLGRRIAVEEHDVTVVVTESDNGGVIEGVNVKLENSRTYEDNTSEQGVVTFNNVREDNYQLTAIKSDWVAVEGVGEVLINRDRTFLIQMAEAESFFEVEIIDYQTEITTLGEDVEIKVEVTNTGPASGKVFIGLFENEFVEDEWVLDKEVQLDQGESKVVELNYEPQDELGIAKFIVKSFNDATGIYDDSDSVWGVVLAEESFAVGFDRAGGNTGDFGDEKGQYLDFVTNIELENDDIVEGYTIIIENSNQEYELTHVDDILEFRFIRDSNWFEIEVVTEGGDISEAVEGLENNYIENITGFTVIEVEIWVNGDLINVPDEGVKIVEWSPFDVETESTGLSESVR